MNRNRTILSLIPLLSLGLLLVPQVTHAQLGFILEGANETAQEIVYFIVTSFFGMFVWFGAALLNFGINQFVIGFGDVYNNSGIGVAVNNTWVIIRDFVNLGFIFGLVYIGLRMILDSSNSNTRRWLANLIIAALLVNFSLFATKFVVDLSNRLATEIACGGLTYPADNRENVSDSYCRDGLYKIDAGSALMARMGLVTLFSQGDSKPDGTGWNYILGTAVLFMVAAFVFIAGGIMLFIRFAVLNLYLVFSAVMFIGWVIPGIPDQMRSYWKGFLSRAFFAPLYLMMLYFSFKIIDGLQVSIRPQAEGATGTSFASPNWQKTLSSNPADNPTDATLGTLPFFVLICIFLMASLVIAQKLGADGASFAQKTAGRATAGILGRIGRNTAGRGANALSKSEYLKDRAANGGFVSRNLARGTMAAGGYGAKATFDARGIKQIGSGKYIQAGDAQKGGFKKTLDDKVKAEKERLKALDTDIDSPEGEKRVIARKKELEAEAKLKLERASTNKDELDKDKDRTEDELTAAILALTEQIKTEEETLKESIENGTITEEEQTTKRGEIDELEQQVAAKENNRDLAKANTERQKARDNYLNTSLSSSSTDQQKSAARDAMQKAEAASEAEFKRRETENTELEEEAEKEEAEADSRAKANIKYARQIAIKKRMEESVWNREYNGFGGGLVGGAVTASLAGGILGFSEAGAYGSIQKEVLKELDKEYGKDGVKKLKKDTRAKKIREEKEALKDDDEDTKKKGGESDSGDKKEAT